MNKKDLKVEDKVAFISYGGIDTIKEGKVINVKDKEIKIKTINYKL